MSDVSNVSDVTEADLVDVVDVTGSDAGATAVSVVSAMLTPEERAERLQAVQAVVELLRPVVQQDGGDLALIAADVETGVVEVQLQGSCSSCAVSSTTLQAGVTRIMKDRLPWVTEVNGGVAEMDEELSESMGRGGYVPRRSY
jgi:Fe-S cluster biogenesis protein NfuA